MSAHTTPAPAAKATNAEPPPWARRDLRFRTVAPVGGFHFGRDECPWIPTEAGCANKFMLFDLARNAFATLFRIDPGCSIHPHYHTTAVVGHVIEGTFKYRESAWIARQGSTVYEPAGEIHTLENIGDVPMIGYFHVTGPEVIVDAQGRQTGWVDAFSLHEYTLIWCAENGVDAAFVARITR